MQTAKAIELPHIGATDQSSAETLSFTQGLWRLADPKISLASMASIFLGTCAAAALGPIHFGWLAVTVVGIFAIEVAKNASGEIFDFDSGADLAVAAEDRTPFSGGKRVLVDRLLTRKQTKWIAAVCYFIGSAAGLAIVVWREPAVFFIGVVGVLCAFLYQAPPVKLSYRGFGELAVAICYGPLICLGTYLVQRHDIALAPLLVSVPLGMLIGNFLLINEFPDARADGAAGKRTLVVRLGRPKACDLFVAVFIIAFAAVASAAAFALSRFVLFGAIAAFPAADAAIRLRSFYHNTPELIPAQAQTLAAFLLYSLGTGIGLLLAR